MIAFALRHWFLVLLAMVLTVGLVFGPQLEQLVRFPRGWLVATVLFLTALPMSFGQLSKAARATRAIVLALVLSTIVAPVLAWLIGQLLPIPLAVGLVVAATVPCTLASAAVWTRRGGGDEAIALLVTLITNLACFLVLPAWLWILLGSEEAAPRGLVIRLLMLVVAPVVVAQLLRLSSTVAEAATRRKPLLSYTAQIGVLTMVFFGAVSAGDTLSRLDSTTITAIHWLALLVAVAVLHLLLFAAGWIGGRAVGSSDANRLAVAVAGSQKTLMIGLDVALGFSGLAVLPMVAYHVTQLILDTLLVDWLRVDDGLQNYSTTNR